MPYIGKKPENIIATAIDSTTGDFSGNVTTGGTHTVTGVSILNGGIDVAGDINFDADGADIKLQDGGVEFGRLSSSSNDFVIFAPTQDKDIIFKGDDGGSAITALTLDMSAAGQANFNSNIFTGNTAEFVDGTGTGDKGIQLNPLGLVVSTRNGGISGVFGRQASDGTIVQFRKNGSEVGRIVYSNDTNIAFGNASRGVGIGSSSVFPTDGSTSVSNGGLSLGYGNGRWNNLYLSGSVFLGGTGSANELDDYEEGTWTPATNSSSYNTGSSTGRYTKIGRVVIAHFSITFSGVNSSSNSIVSITGLPFTSTSVIQFSGSVREQDNTGAIYTTRLGASSTTINMNSMDNVTNGSQRTIRTSEEYSGTMTYML